MLFYLNFCVKVLDKLEIVWGEQYKTDFDEDDEEEDAKKDKNWIPYLAKTFPYRPERVWEMRTERLQGFKFNLFVNLPRKSSPYAQLKLADGTIVQADECKVGVYWQQNNDVKDSPNVHIVTYTWTKKDFENPGPKFEFEIDRSVLEQTGVDLSRKATLVIGFINPADKLSLLPYPAPQLSLRLNPEYDEAEDEYSDVDPDEEYDEVDENGRPCYCYCCCCCCC